MVRVAATGVPLSCTLPSQVGKMRSRAAETVTRAEVQRRVLSRPTAESAPPRVIHAESQSPTWSAAMRAKWPSVHSSQSSPLRCRSSEMATPRGKMYTRLTWARGRARVRVRVRARVRVRVRVSRMERAGVRVRVREKVEVRGEG